MESSVLDAALSQGIWAVLAVFLLIYIVKSNERFSARQEEREKQYQELLSALTEKFNVLSVIERDITEVKEYIMADTKEINKKIYKVVSENRENGFLFYVSAYETDQ